MAKQAAHNRVDLRGDGKAVAGIASRGRPPASAALHDAARDGPSEAVSADSVLTRNAGTGSAVTHEPGSKMQFSL